MTSNDTPTFKQLGVHPKLTAKLGELGLHRPFPIQASTIGDALAGRDVCGKAPTGSGKTLAFSLPLAMLTERAQPTRPAALVLVPTRELATQVRQTLQPLAQRLERRVATVYGGTPIGKDIKRLRSGVDILVACPGRLADLVRRDICDLRQVKLVVIDEADRMADMGFLPEVQRLLDMTKPDRQTLLFSATLDGAVDTLVRRYQKNPVHHEVETPEDERGDVRHLFFGSERHERRDAVLKVLGAMSPAIVFTRTKHGADRLAKQLERSGVSSAAIHGDRSQRQRERALAQFTAGDVSTLVATDVAARGIHVDAVALVVHYDLPNDPKDYVHRSGRTGRAGADGVVVSFVGHDDTKTLDQLQRTVGLPRGLHAMNLAFLTDDRVPEPTVQTGHSRTPAGRSTKPSGGRSGQRRRNGNASGNRRRNNAAGGSRQGSKTQSRANGGRSSGSQARTSASARSRQAG